LTADNSVFLYSNAKDMCVTQDLNSFVEIIAHAQCSVDEKKNWFTRHETDKFLNNHCQECVRNCLSFLHKIMIGNHRTKTFLHKVMIGNHLNKTTES
jgi:hypothetical protein